jgi:hypothetical protein
MRLNLALRLMAAYCLKPVDTWKLQFDLFEAGLSIFGTSKRGPRLGFRGVFLF